MKRIPALIVKWLANKLGFKVVMLKAANGTVTIEGDMELLRYVDDMGYFFKKEPLSRHKPKAQVISQDEKLKQVTIDNLKNLGIEVEPFKKHF